LNFLVVEEEEAGYPKRENLLDVITPALSEILVQDAVFFDLNFGFYFGTFLLPAAFDAQDGSVFEVQRYGDIGNVVSSLFIDVFEQKSVIGTGFLLNVGQSQFPIKA